MLVIFYAILKTHIHNNTFLKEMFLLILTADISSEDEEPQK
jgi:hypothetical protein